MQSKFSKVFCPPQTQSGQIVNFQHLEVIHTTWRKVFDLDKVLSALRCHRTAWEQCQFLKCRYQFTYARCRDIQTLHVHIMVLVDLCCCMKLSSGVQTISSSSFLLHHFSTSCVFHFHSDEDCIVLKHWQKLLSVWSSWQENHTCHFRLYNLHSILKICRPDFV